VGGDDKPGGRKSQVELKEKQESMLGKLLIGKIKKRGDLKERGEKRLISVFWEREKGRVQS